METETLLLLKEVTGQEAHDIFQGRGVHDRVEYYEGKNTRWFLFSDPPIGHAAMMKIGPGHQDSCHYRFGRWWIAPEYRGTSLGPLHAGALIYQFLRHEMTDAPYKVITMHAWNEQVPKYEARGWINTQKQFKGPFVQLRKVFYFSFFRNELIEQRGSSGSVCEGIIYPGDYQIPVQFIPLK
jgi:predicted GNAT family N-acyltransferase